jgi:hypothetical protein
MSDVSALRTVRILECSSDKAISYSIGWLVKRCLTNMAWQLLHNHKSLAPSFEQWSVNKLLGSKVACRSYLA